MPVPAARAHSEEKWKWSANKQYSIYLKQGSGDKAIKTIVKKVGAQQLGVDEVNFFRDDGTILHFSKPEAYASIQNNTFIVSGEPDTKNIQDLLPDIIQQLGPKQHKLLMDIVQKGTQQAPSSEEVPNLVSEAPADLNKPEWWTNNPYLNIHDQHMDSLFYSLFYAFEADSRKENNEGFETINQKRAIKRGYEYNH